MTPPHHLARPFARLLPVAVLLAAHYGLALRAAWYNSPTFDEIPHLTAGYSYWITGDRRLNPEHPPLAKLWAALPLLVTRPTFPELDRADWWESNDYLVGQRFFFQSGNDADAMLRSARAMIALLSVALGTAVYVWSRRLFGTAGGLVSLTLYAFSPTMLAHSVIVNSDLAVSLFFLLAAGGLGWVFRAVRPASLVASLAATAGLFLSKMSAVLIAPVAAALLLSRVLSQRPLTVVWGREQFVQGRLTRLGVLAGLLVLHVAAVALAIWAAHGFRFAALREAVPGRDRFHAWTPPAEGQTAWEHGLSDLGPEGEVIRWARDHRLLPEAYLYGFAFQLQASGGRDAFLAGRRSDRGWWYFFPYCFAVKTPLPLIALLARAAWVSIRGRRAAVRRERPGARHPLMAGLTVSLGRTAPLWALLVVYSLFLLISKVDIGHRYMLPIYPPLFILAGAAADPGWGLGRPARWLTVALVALFTAGSLRISPHYLAYFNSLVGGPARGYRRLVDSSLDWGQDLRGLRDWLDRKALTPPQTPEGRPNTPVYLSCFGTVHPHHYGIRAELLPGYWPWLSGSCVPLTGGWYCISATMLQQVYLLPESRWTASLEEQYQALRPRIERLEATRNDLADFQRLLEERGPAALEQEVALFSGLRFARLSAFLRQREPDDHVGYSILLYRLSDADVRAALDGPPPELFD